MSSVEIRKENDKTVVNLKGKQYLWFSPYLDGYYKSTLLLLDNLNLQNKTLIYPILLNFSHYLELWIKLLLLAINDSNNVKDLKINNHSIQKIIKDEVNNHKSLLELYNVDTNALYQIVNKYSYFLGFICEATNLSMAARYPLSNKGSNIIINFDKVEEAEYENYADLKTNVLDILKITSQITKDFFERYFLILLKEEESKNE